MRRALGPGILAALLLAAWAGAFIPLPDRTMRAVAEVNRASGRSQALQLELTMRVGDREPIASGELISHPSGLARLELRGYRGRVDRYLLSGSELLAAKDGRRLDRPQPMLQPLFLMQPASETTLRAALETFGVQSDWIGLATCGDQDCFVFGDPRLAAPLPEPEPASSPEDADVLEDPLAGPDALESEGASEATGELGAESDPLADLEDGSEGALDGPALVLPEDGRIPRFWVDTKELQIRRIDRSSGVFVIFGPMVSFEKLKVPAWFEIHEPSAPTIRFDVERAVQVNAPPKAFSRRWLYAPTDAPASPESDEPEP